MGISGSKDVSTVCEIISCKGLVMLNIFFYFLIDVINVSGHRLSTAEIESALILHKGVAETAGNAPSHSLDLCRALSASYLLQS